MSDTTYTPGIYQDIDGDVIKVDADGEPQIIAYGTPGHPLGNHIDMRYATRIGNLTPSPNVVTAEPTLEDGIYRDTDHGEVVLIKDGKVVEVLSTGDSCSTESHLPYYQGNNPDLSDLVRLVAPDTRGALPTDGFYADADGDLVQVKNGQVRYLNDPNYWALLADEYPEFAPYTPLVEATAK